jgi:hypothetical protein
MTEMAGRCARSSQDPQAAECEQVLAKSGETSAVVVSNGSVVAGQPGNVRTQKPQLEPVPGAGFDPHGLAAREV